jgi:hypothetical protein
MQWFQDEYWINSGKTAEIDPVDLPQIHRSNTLSAETEYHESSIRDKTRGLSSHQINQCRKSGAQKPSDRGERQWQ